MRYLTPLFVFALAFAQPLGAQERPLPYKLIISWYQSNLIVIDYPTKVRCEAAAKAVNDEVERKIAEVSISTGAVPVIKGPNGAFCIPG